ncbi:ATP-dependent helicase [Candidatus Collierbacteria bacterium]|nr:ATP-dependent helicase [Candidatus Collierbacteria bacterium]
MSTIKSAFPLNPAQKKAVEAIEGPVMVIAGPGTGKTQTLTLRIAHILKSTDTPPNGILALTFTDAAAREMRERLVKSIGPTAYYVNIQTFHSFCSSVIQGRPDIFQSMGQLEPLSDLERAGLFRNLIDNGDYQAIRPNGAPYLYIRDLVSSIANLKREGISPEEFQKLLAENPPPDAKDKYFQRNLDLVKVYNDYNSELKKLNRYDFEDMISFVTQAFSQDKNLLLEHQEKFLYILVDEYQDTNAAQNALLLHLSSYWGQNANLFVVGDDDQAIFRFQGASIENILSFHKLFKKAEIVVLSENYRSQQLILDASREIISRNRLSLVNSMPQVEKNLRSAINKSQVEKIRVARFSSSAVELFFAASEIQKLIKAGEDPNEIAVIFRNRSDGTEMADMLSRFDIQFNLEGGQDILTRPVIEKLIMLMKTIEEIRNGQEGVDLFTLLNQPFFNCGQLDILKLSRFCADKKIKLWDGLISLPPNLNDPASLINARKILSQLQQDDADGPFTLFFEKLIHKTGFLDWCLKSDDSIEKLNSVNSLFSEIKKLNSANHNLRLKDFLEIIALMIEQKVPIYEEDLDIKTGAISLLTAHKAKGREFSTVFIIKAIDGKWGNNLVRELIKLPTEIISNTDLSIKEKNEDERRLFYVALTRAKKRIYITSAIAGSTEQRKKESVETMFLSEIPEKFLDRIDPSGYERQGKKILEVLLKVPAPQKSTLEESKFLSGIVKTLILSPTALNTYLNCPYKFKLNNLLRAPRAKAIPMSFGSAIHKALEIFFREFKKTQKMPSVAILRSTFKMALEKEILTSIENERLLKRGLNVLEEYVSYYKDLLVPPFEVEKFFGYGFSKIVLNGIPLGGKIDKIEKISENREQETGNNEGGQKARVIDYKTGSAKSRNEIEGKTAQSNGDYKRQLVFYKLLADLDKTFKLTVSEAELDFVEPDRSTGKFKKERFTITETEVEKLKKTIKNVWKDILDLKFPRTADVKKHCPRCEWRLHCWPEGISSATQTIK